MMQNECNINADFIIYISTKNPMQSVLQEEKIFVERNPNKSRDSLIFSPLTDWAGSSSSGKQVRLTFNSIDEAIKYLNQQNFSYFIQKKTPKNAKSVRKKSYISNFLSNE